MEQSPRMGGRFLFTFCCAGGTVGITRSLAFLNGVVELEHWFATAVDSM